MIRPLRAVGQLYRDAFAGLPAVTWLLCTAAFLNRCGSMVVPFLGLYAKNEFAFDPEQAGALLSMYGAGAFAGSWLGGWLTDRIGPIRSQVVSLGASGTWMLAMIAVRGEAVLFASVFVLGVLNDAFRPGSITAVAVSVPPELRRKALSLNRLALNLGWACGPTLGGFLTEIDFAWMFVADGATCLLAAGFLAVRFRGWPERPRAGDRPGARGTTGGPMPGAAPAAAAHAHGAASPFRDRHFLWLMLANLIVLVAFMQYFTTGSRVLEDDGWSRTQIGFFLAINPVMITLFEMAVVQLLRGQRALPVIAAGSALVGSGYLCMLLPWGAGAIALTMAIVAGGELLQMPLLGAHVNDHAPPHARGAYNGAYGMCFCAALLLAPIAGGHVYKHHGPEALWWSCAACGVVAAAMFAATPAPRGPAR
jgi:predicted MFS family arabinose efflux permease